MVSPVTPSNVKALLPAGGDNICQLMIKFLKSSILWYQWYRYAYDADGNITPGYKGELCAAIKVCA